MCIAPGKQRNGIGTRLLEHLLSALKENDNVNEVYLLTDASSDAESFYLARGFHRSERKIVLSHGLERAALRSKSAD